MLSAAAYVNTTADDEKDATESASANRTATQRLAQIPDNRVAENEEADEDEEFMVSICCPL